MWVFLAQGCSQGVSRAGVLEALVGLENLLPGRVPHVAVDKRPPFLATWAAQVSSQQGSWLPPEQVIQERDQGGVLSAFHDTVLSPRHSHRTLLLEWSHQVWPTPKEEGIKLHLLKKGIAENSWMGFKTTELGFKMRFVFYFCAVKL